MWGAARGADSIEEKGAGRSPPPTLVNRKACCFMRQISDYLLEGLSLHIRRPRSSISSAISGRLVRDFYSPWAQHAEQAGRCRPNLIRSAMPSLRPTMDAPAKHILNADAALNDADCCGISRRYTASPRWHGSFAAGRHARAFGRPCYIGLQFAFPAFRYVTTDATYEIKVTLLRSRPASTSHIDIGGSYFHDCST